MQTGKTATKQAGIQRQGKLTASLLSKTKQILMLTEKLATKTKSQQLYVHIFLYKINSSNERILALRNCSFFGVIMALSLCF